MQPTVKVFLNNSDFIHVTATRARILAKEKKTYIISLKPFVLRVKSGKTI